MAFQLTAKLCALRSYFVDPHTDQQVASSTAYKANPLVNDPPGLMTDRLLSTGYSHSPRSRVISLAGHILISLFNQRVAKAGATGGRLFDRPVAALDERRCSLCCLRRWALERRARVVTCSVKA